jgi:hypothetical protein
MTSFQELWIQGPHKKLSAALTVEAADSVGWGGEMEKRSCSVPVSGFARLRLSTYKIKP